MRRISYCGWLLLCFASLVFMMGCVKEARQQVCFRGGCVDVELALTPEEWQKGLSKRSSLNPQKGMLFVFKTIDYHAFWMKDTSIPLDMIWINASQRIVHIEKNVPPCLADPCPVYQPPEPALYVLEIKAGVADHLKIEYGGKADFSL